MQIKSKDLLNMPPGSLRAELVTQMCQDVFKNQFDSVNTEKIDNVLVFGSDVEYKHEDDNE